MKSLLSLSSCAVVLLSLSACRVSVETQTRYEREGGNVDATAADAYAPYDKVSVKLRGVIASGINFTQNGGIVVQSGDVAKVSVSARVIGYGYAEDKADATVAIRNVAESVSVTKSGDTWVVSCGQDEQGSATAGCEYLEVTVPRGTSAAPLDVALEADNGTVNANFLNDVVGNLTIDATGAGGVIVAQANPAVGATLSLSSDNGDVRLDLPSDSSVDQVRLQGRTKAEAASGETFSDCDFSDSATFDGTAFSFGTTGDGAASVTLTSASEAVRLKKPGAS